MVVVVGSAPTHYPHPYLCLVSLYHTSGGGGGGGVERRRRRRLDDGDEGSLDPCAAAEE